MLIKCVFYLPEKELEEKLSKIAVKNYDSFDENLKKEIKKENYLCVFAISSFAKDLNELIHDLNSDGVTIDDGTKLDISIDSGTIIRTLDDDKFYFVNSIGLSEVHDF